ncbi:MAG: cytochrome c3 family protein [Bacteroidetes bacterium]|nr:cytochrome c3 family protein [Bacteroidota bacterium]
MDFKNKIRYFVLAFLAASLYSCSPRSNYKVLSTLFDGVPNPYTIDSAENVNVQNREPDAVNSAVTPQKPDYVVHPPYQEKDCALCHDQRVMGRLLATLPGLCYQCHENFADQYQVLHGPVEAGFCSECHNPHLTKNRMLLKKVGQELCFQCHTSQNILEGEIHSEIGETDCIDCHNPHGGEDRFIFN